MWSCKVLFLAFIAVGVTASNTAWKPGAVYTFKTEARTLTAIHQVDDVYAGVVFNGELEIRPSSKYVLIAKLYKLKYASVQARLPGGWNSPIPEQYLNMKPLPVSGKPFEIKLQEGLVTGLVVSSEVPTWEVNLLKAVASQLQVNAEGKQLVPGSHSTRPDEESIYPNGVFRAMEDSIAGNCEVLYDIAPLPAYIALAEPQLAPLVRNPAETPLIEVVKTQNYSNCDQRVSFNFGFPGASEFQHPSDNQAADFLSRSTVSRVILSGSLRRYTIQSSVTTSKVIVSPLLYNKQKAMVVSSLNLTLASLSSSSRAPQAVRNGKKYNNLGYSYENAYNYKIPPGRSFSDASSSSTSWSSGHSSSSNEHVSAPASSGERSFPRSTSSGSSEEIPPGSGSTIRWPMEEDRSRSSSSAPTWEPEDESSQQSASASRIPRTWPSIEEDESSPIFGGMRQKRSLRRPSSMQSSAQDEYPSASRNWPASDERSSKESSSQQSGSEETRLGYVYWNKSREEEIYLPYPAITEPLEVPMLPLFAGFSSKPIGQKVPVVDLTKRLSHEIASDARNQNFMVRQNSLAKFVWLTEVIRTMGTKQLQAVTSSLYTTPSTSSSESQEIRLLAWRIYRDAVAEAGTPAALMVIKDWIINSKVEGEEAAQLVAVIPSSALLPTAEYIHELFKLISSEKVLRQQHLNTTALLSFARLIRMSQIDNSTLHKYYPTHTYGRPVSQRNKDVQEIYIPHLKKRLEKAVAQNDSVKIQVYTSAIGNIGHPIILKIFEPYLERKVNITTFQRSYMVINMYHLVKLYPEFARPVLFKIYQNTAEAHELRCAAVSLLLAANPPKVMLQRMAEFTNYDRHAQVNAAVVSGIQALANLKAPAYHELARAARSAVNMLNTTQLPKHFTGSYIRSYESENYPLAYSQFISYVGSDDTVIPKFFYFNVTKNIGGIKNNPISFGAMTSSVANLLEQLKSQIPVSKPGHDSESESDELADRSPWDRESEFTLSRINKLLDLKLDQAEPVEGNVMINFAGSYRMFAFDNSSIPRIPEVVQYIMGALSSEKKFNYTKYFDQSSLTLAFPVASGLPFVYTLRTPSVISVGGKGRVRAQIDEERGWGIPKAVNATGLLDIWYSMKVQSELGFLTPFDNKHYISGVNKDFQFKLPLQAKLDVDLENTCFKLAVEPIHEGEPSKLVYYGTTPIVAKHDILNLEPLIEEKSCEIISNEEWTHMDADFGEQSIGVPMYAHYNVSGNWSSIPGIVAEAEKDPMMLVYCLSEMQDLRASNFSLGFLSKKAHPEPFVLTFAIAKTLNSSNWNDQSIFEERSEHRSKHWRSKSWNPSLPEASKPQRINELLLKASSGIKNSSAVAVDLAIQFPGRNDAEFVATAAIAKSPVDENSRLVAWVYQKPAYQSRRPLQVCFDVETKDPYVPLLNYKEARKAIPYMSAEASLDFGETCAEGRHIMAQAKFTQSKERIEFVSRQPMAQLCESQMSEGNYALPACRNATAEANFMDQLDVHIKYDDLPVAIKNITYKSYSLLLYWLYPYVDEEVFIENPIHNEIKLKSKLSPNLKELSVHLETPIVNSKLEHFPLGPIAGPLLAVHPVHSAIERLSRVALADQWIPKCTIGNSAVNTFDNNTYPVYMGKCWHVMLKWAPKPFYQPAYAYSSNMDKFNDMAVLVRDAGSQKKDVMIITGEDVIELTPYKSRQDSNRAYATGRIQVNGVSLKVSSNNVTYIYKDHGAIWAQIFSLPSGEISLKYPIHGLSALYDGQTIQLSGNDSFRDNIRGLCGTFDGEPISDFTVPNGYYLNDTQLFSASYALPDDCQGPVASLRRKAIQQGAVRPGGTFIPFNFISDEDIWGADHSISDESDSNSSPDSPGRPKSPKIGIVFRTKVEVEGSQICFSIKPLPGCAPGTHPISRVQKSIAMFCLNSNNPTARKLKAMVDNGANPDLRRKGITKYINVKLPLTCALD